MRAAMAVTLLGLICPQCGGTLPWQARWRTVSCPYCRTAVTRQGSRVERAAFRAAWSRDQDRGHLHLDGRAWRLLQPLGRGEHCEVWLAERGGAMRERATLKLALSPTPSLAREADVLRALQALDGTGSAYYSQRLPEVIQFGTATGRGDPAEALALRHPIGHWGSLADVLAHRPLGLEDPRHIAWLWRRALEVLGYVHDAGWTHGDLQPAHWLLHPGDHGVRLIGWGRGQRGGDPAVDLMQTAWTLRHALAPAEDAPPKLPDRVPTALRDLLAQASTDAEACRRWGAAGLHAAVGDAARAAFGPPTFVPFHPHTA